jgi:hypothetical protein
VLMEASNFGGWLTSARVAEGSLTTDQRGLLQMGWHFLETCGRDYYSVRLLGHVLLHGQSGLSVAAIARLLGISRAAASGQQKLSSKEVVQAASQRLRGRGHGKLLPRFAGPIAQFLVQRPQATRWDLLDFIQTTWGVHVSRMALHKFLKKFGLDQVHEGLPGPASQTAAAPAGAVPRSGPAQPVESMPALESVAATVEPAPPSGGVVSLPPRDFFLAPPTTQEPFSSCPRRSTGWPPPRRASRTTTARCGADC